MEEFICLKDKYENANARWVSHWWDKLKKYYDRNQEVRKAYVLDEIDHSISVRVQEDLPEVKNNKEFLYVGHYYDSNGYYVLKIGTTNSLERRQREHSKNYGSQFYYDWWLPLSKYNTLRYEDRNRELWKIECVGKFMRNDRFLCYTKPKSVTVKVRKEYNISL